MRNREVNYMAWDDYDSDNSWENEMRHQQRQQWENYQKSQKNNHGEGGGCGVFLLFCLIIGLFKLADMFYTGFVFTYWGPVVVTFHMPVDKDLYDDYYLRSAAEYANEHVKQLQKKNWEEKNMAVFTSDNRYWKWHSIRRDWLDGKYWSGYEDKNVITIHNPSLKYKVVKSQVIYDGANTYTVKTSLPMDFIAIDSEGKSGDIYASAVYEYSTTLTCDPKRNFYGTIDMGWNVADSECIAVSQSEDTLMSLSGLEINEPLPADI